MGFILLAVITGLSAFLLFQIELILGKLLLPHYGGSYLVWGSCIVFFQAVLLLGYIFAHHCIKKWGVGKYLTWHMGLMLVPLLFFPGRALHVSANDGHQWPLVIDVFWRLTTTIGPVFFVLSTVSLVTQSWLSRSGLPQRLNPYALYAVSNLGSFLALLTYPFAVERHFGLTEQLSAWRIGYFVLICLSIFTILRVKPTKDVHRAQQSISPSVPLKDQMRWLALSAGAVIMFLSVTSLISYEIAPVPLLWIFPLAIYLLSFVFNFGPKPWKPAFINGNVGGIIGLNLAIFFLVMKTMIPTIIMVIVLCWLLFILCMYAQRTLIGIKPKDDGQLTKFYVMISLGGFLGGILATWIIPLVSTMLIEFIVGLLLIALASSTSPKIRPLWQVGVGIVLIAAIFIGWPLLFKSYSILGIIILFGGLYLGFKWVSAIKPLLIGICIAVIFFSSLLEAHWKSVKFIAKYRNYYGIYQIFDKNNIRLIMHGTTLHGVQLNDPASRHIPMGYYSPMSADGNLIIKDYFEVKRMGVVGLGAGTLSMYAQPDRAIDIFELDPDVLTMAQKYFWYLSLAPGEVKNIIGDARVSLKGIDDHTYQLLVIDAFGGDAIPVHLINKDVVRLYQTKITESGAILFHITNRYIDLEPVLANIARELGSWVAVKEVPDGGVNMRSLWAVMTWDRERMAQLIGEDGWRAIGTKDYAPSMTWTDDYSSVLPMLKLSEFVGSLQHFNFLKIK